MMMAIGCGISTIADPGLTGTLREHPVFQHVNFRRSDPAAIHLGDPQLRPDAQGRGRLVQDLRRNACVDQGSQQHVAGDSGKALNRPDLHRVHDAPRPFRAPESISAGSNSFMEPDR